MGYYFNFVNGCVRQTEDDPLCDFTFGVNEPLLGSKQVLCGALHVARHYATRTYDGRSKIVNSPHENKCAV